MMTMWTTTSSVDNGSVLLWMFEFFLFVLWFWLLMAIFSDLFRDHEASGWTKVGWSVLVILLPFLGILLYVLIRGRGMTQRNVKQHQAMQQEFDDRVRAAAGSPASATGQIAQAKSLLDSGAITAAEFETIKAKALAA